MAQQPSSHTGPVGGALATGRLAANRVRHLDAAAMAGDDGQVLIRPLRPEDLPAAQAVTAAAEPTLASAATARPDLAWPDPAERFRARAEHLIRQDGPGCWLAELAGRAVGVVLTLRREGLWGLSLLAVDPIVRGAGVGTALLLRAAQHGAGCLRGLAVAGDDPALARLCRRAGFSLHPAMRLSGEVDRDGLPSLDGLPVHEAGAGHTDLFDSFDRRVRGAAHGVDHAAMLARRPALVVDTLTAGGYCYLGPAGVTLLAATSRRVAAALLVEALARLPAGAPARIGAATAEQQWAVDVGLDAGLAPRVDGYVCCRGMSPAAPYLPDDAYL